MPAYITKGDLKTHIYQDIITEIIRGDDTIADKAIKSAYGEIKSYLNKYDLTKLFSDQIEDEHLNDKVKDVACWKLVKLANPNIDMQLFKDLNDASIAWFKEIMKGNADPENWPYKTDSTETAFVEGSSMSWSSNRKRKNHF